MARNAIRGLVILGFGGHSRSVADIALQCGIRNMIFVDHAAKHGESLWKFPVLKRFDGPLSDGWQAFPGAGNNEERNSQILEINRRRWPLATVISPTATICTDAIITAGCFIGHHAHLGPLARIETGVILNTGAIVDHESKIGYCSHVSVNAAVAGRCKLGKYVFLGAGAVVIDGIEVGDSITIGAGGVVERTTVISGTYVGVPARLKNATV